MSVYPGDSALGPGWPYPGLRPFRDDESIYYFGRKQQIEEVIDRLRFGRFVVVLGGSGSGKSSLIKAGVIPELRSYRLTEAGDVWLPVVATPGTNLADESVVQARRRTPIERLAEKLAEACGGDAAVDAIAATLRQRHGLTRLVHEHGVRAVIDADASPAVQRSLAERANFLVVLDQFEEIFHPSNKDVGDCRLLVERVLEHFLDPHPRVYVVLTMRSEYLNRCASYLKLPDAINSASYLVRRLAPYEIDECIQLPAQCYVQMLADRAPPGADVPASVEFDAAVLDRLHADVERLSEDPDHLPLLQHLLARMWEAAETRARLAGALAPSRITAQDLADAVSASDPIADARLPVLAADNVLASCIERWAERLWDALPPADQHALEGLLPLLAFKDPNTGEYVQRRVFADDAAALLLPGTGASGLQALVAPFLAPRDYFYWDDKPADKPVTLKVSHEALIRGWSRFRLLIDHQATRFEEFVAVLRRCAGWSASRDPAQLLETSEIERLEKLDLDGVFSDQEERRDWFGVLLEYREGKRLANLESVAGDFLRLSRELRHEEQRRDTEAAERDQQREQELSAARERALQKEADRLKALGEADRASTGRREAELTAARAQAVGRRNLVVAGLCVLLMTGVVLLLQLQSRVMSAAEKFYLADNKVDEAGDPRAGNPQPGAAVQRLGALVQGAEAVRSVVDVRATFDDAPLRWFNGSGPVLSAERLLAFASTESKVNQALRALLTSSIWAYPHDAASGKPPGQEIKSLRINDGCEVQSVQRPGSLFVNASGVRIAGRQRGVFVTVGRLGDLSLHAVMVDGRACSARAEFWTVPGHIKPRILFDARLRYMALVQKAEQGEFVTLYEIVWTFDGEEIDRVGLEPLSLNADPDHLRQIEKAFEKSKDLPDGAVRAALSVPTWRVAGGYVVRVGERYWRLFNNGSQAIDGTGADDWDRLLRRSDDSPCAQIQAPSPGPERAVRSNVFAWGGRCVEIQRTQLSNVAAEAAQATPAGPAQAIWDDNKPQRVDVALYEVLPPDSSASTAARALRRLAGFKAYDRRACISDESEWLIGRPDRAYAGWIALPTPVAEAGAAACGAETGTVSGAPLSTDALWALGKRTLQDAETAARAAASSASGPGTMTSARPAPISGAGSSK
jgi:hypothetical protein